MVACNTATAAAIQTLRSEYGIPFVGMEPAVKPAALGTRSGVIGVLATAGTLKGSKYLNTKGRFQDEVKIVERVGKGFVELVESGELTGPHAEKVVGDSLRPLLEAGADTVVLWRRYAKSRDRRSVLSTRPRRWQGGSSRCLKKKASGPQTPDPMSNLSPQAPMNP